MKHEFQTVSAPHHGEAFFSVEETRTTHPGLDGERVHHVVRHPGGSAVVALDGKDLLLVQQYRPAVDDVLLEVPAGRREAGETPAGTALRELQEETGFQAREVTLLFDFFNAPCFCDGVTHLFLATDLREPEGPRAAELRTVRVPLAEASALVAAGRITDAKTIIGILAVLTRIGGTGNG